MVFLALAGVSFVMPAVVLDDDPELADDEVAAARDVPSRIRDPPVHFGVREPSESKQQPDVGLGDGVGATRDEH